MIPIRLTLLLLGIGFILLLILGNPQPVTIHLIFWDRSFELYKIIIGSVFLGILLTFIYSGHVRSLRRYRTKQPDRK